MNIGNDINLNNGLYLLVDWIEFTIKKIKKLILRKKNKYINNINITTKQYLLIKYKIKN